MSAIAITDKLEARLRGVVKDDWAYILDSWKKSYRDSEKRVPAHIYWANQHTEIEQLRQGGAEFRVAHDPDDSNFIWGWACVEGDTVHYVFVRASARGQGVAKLLLTGIVRPIVATHWTESAEQVHKKHPGALLFEPSRRKR